LSSVTFWQIDMQPRKPESSRHDDLFRTKLEQMINQRHELCRLAQVIDWPSCEQRFGALYADEGRPGLPLRLLVGLEYLKHAFNESDESVVARWVENPYWQYFCGEEVLLASSAARSLADDALSPAHRRLWLEWLLQLTVQAGVATQTVKRSSLSVVNVDTTVQEKAIAFPTDARLYHKARKTLVRHAKQVNIALRQS
jgi:IS5 family transposase